MFTRLRSAAACIHRDEQGDEGVNKVLIIAMIVIPLVYILIVFGDQIAEFFDGIWSSLKDGNNQAGTSNSQGSEESIIGGPVGGDD